MMRMQDMLSGLLLFAALMSAGCGETPGEAAMEPACSLAKLTGGAQTGMRYKYVTNSLVLPYKSSPFGSDIDGDGLADNQLKKLVSLVVNTFELQNPISQSFANGRGVLLLEEQAADLSSAECSGTTVHLAEPWPSGP